MAEREGSEGCRGWVDPKRFVTPDKSSYGLRRKYACLGVRAEEMYHHSNVPLFSHRRCCSIHSPVLEMDQNHFINSC